MSMSYNIYIIADSRGAFLQSHLDRYNMWPNVTLTVEVYKGKGLTYLWNRARYLLQSETANFVYLLGGICDLTKKIYINGRREYWVSKRPRDRIFDLQCIITNIGDEALQLDMYGKLSIIQEIGCDLIRYNRVIKPAIWMCHQQKDFDEWLPSLHRTIKANNYKLGVRTPWVLDCIYTHSSGRRFYPRYHMLHDGLHPTQEVANKIASQITKDVNEAYSESR